MATVVGTSPAVPVQPSSGGVPVGSGLPAPSVVPFPVGAAGAGAVLPPVVTYMDRNGNSLNATGQEQILATFAIDPTRWTAYQQARKRLYPYQGCEMPSVMCCVVPWVAHFVVFAPCLWCIATVGRCTGCLSYQEEPLPHWHRQALTITNFGVRGYRKNEASGAWEPQAITWDGFSFDKVMVGRALGSMDSRCVVGMPNQLAPDVDASLAVPIGTGCLLPCCAYLFCAQDIPGYYKLVVPSNGTHVVGHGEHRRHVINAVIELPALEGEPDAILNLMRQTMQGMGFLAS